VHKVSKTLVVISLLAPLGASALGVGDMHLHSGMNQYLDAEIPLVLSGSDTLNDVRVSLASPEEFAKAGIDRQYFLSKLQFRPIQKPDGRYAIRVTSREAIREPFLNFMVEVNWPRGRALREYTVLLDPPTERADSDRRGDDEPADFESPGSRYDRPRPTERAAEISRSEPGPPVSRRHRPFVSAQPDLAPDLATAQPPAKASPPPPTREQLAGTYGPVQREETLWSIAKRIERDPAVTQEQMVMGLYHANPGAFGGTINSLKAGSVLRVPGQEYLAQMSPDEARRAFARTQGRRGSRLAARDYAPSPLPAEEALPPQSQVKLLPPPVSNSRTRGDAAVAGGDTAAPGGARNQGDLALEVAETMKQENDEFRTRMTQMEQRLTEMQRMISLKDEQIAALIAKQKAEPVVQPPAAKPQPTPAATAPPVPVAPLPTPPPLVKPPATPSEVPSPAARPLPPAQPGSPPPPVAPKPVSTPAASEPSGPALDPAYLGLAGGLGLLGLGAWLFKRRRDTLMAGSDLTRPDFDEANVPGIAETVSLSTAGRVDNTATTPRDPLLNEYVNGSYDVLGTEADEVDPISEADVYLAYGRSKQAEELIRNAIAHHPERGDFKLKLLEIFQSTDNRDAFLTYVQELQAQGRDRDREFWSEVQGRLQELLPEESVARTGLASAPAREDEPNLPGLGGLDLNDESLIDDLRKFGDHPLEEPHQRLGDIDLSESALTDNKPADMPPVKATPTKGRAGIPEGRQAIGPASPEKTESLGDLDLSDPDFIEALDPDLRQPRLAPETDLSFPDLDFIGDKGEKDDGTSDPSFASILDLDDLTADSSGLGEPEDVLKELESLLSLDFEDDASPQDESDEGIYSATAEREKSLDELLQELTAGLAQEQSAGTAGLDAPATEASSPSPAAVAEQPLAFDLDDLDLLLANAGQPPSSEPESGTGASEEDRSLNFDLALDTAQRHPAADAPEDVSIDPGRILEFNLDELEAVAPEPRRGSAEAEDFEFDIDGIGDLTDMDPFETKLDLARAYADMEDQDSAREILSDVTLNGSEQQKKEAAELLQKLDGGPGKPAASALARHP
jgi:pilus assembly protein FimV